MTNKEFANALAWCVEKGKISKSSKLISEFIETHSDGSAPTTLTGDPTPEIIALSKKLPSNLKIKDDTINDVILKAKAMKGTEKKVTTKTTSYRASEW